MAVTDRKRGPPGEGLGASMRRAQPYIDASWQFVGAVALCTWLGYWLDGRFGTTPWLLVAGSMLGMIVGTVSLVRVVTRLQARDRQQPPKGGPDLRA